MRTTPLCVLCLATLLAAACSSEPPSSSCEEGASCDDGDLCTGNDLCTEGVCLGTPITCGEDGDPCTDGVCEPFYGCVLVANQAACDDGDPCTEGDRCANWRCVGGAAPSCDDGDPCTEDLCETGVGCAHAPRSGGSCDDGDVCTAGETCFEGSCGPGEPISCDDGDVCTDDTCDSALGCQHATRAEGCDDQNPCTADRCEAATGCVHEPVAGSCDDLNPCTTLDACFEGSCHGGPAPDCDDANPCTDDACDVQLGCRHSENAAPCDDGNPCTEGDQCAAGTCLPGAPASCDDGEICTGDLCSPTEGCLHLPQTALCDDGDPWTTGERCVAGSCAPGATAAGTLSWARLIGRLGTSRASAVAAAADGGWAVCGSFDGTVFFGEGTASEVRLTSVAQDDAFVARYASDGTLLWARAFGGAAVESCRGLAVRDSDGSVTAAGVFGDAIWSAADQTAVFGAGEPNQTTLQSTRDGAIYLARLDARGALQWARRECNGSSPLAHGIALSADGGVWLTGSVMYGATFGAGSSNQTTLPSSFSSQVFVARYAADGAFVRAWGTGANDRGGTVNVTDFGGIAVDPRDGSVVVVASFLNAAVFGAGQAHETSLTPGSHDGFVARYSPQGELAWVKRAAGNSAGWLRSVAVGADGSVAVAGAFETAVTFGEGEPGATTLSGIAMRDLAVALLDADGSLRWAVSAGGVGSDVARTVAFVGGEVLAAGSFSGTASFSGVGGATPVQLVAEGIDPFLARFSSTGQLSWVKQGGCSGNAVAVQASGSGLLVAGSFGVDPVFGAGEPGELALASSAGTTACVARHGGDGAFQALARASLPGGDEVVQAVALDPVDDAAVVAGVISNRAELAAPGAAAVTLVTAGGEDVLLARYSPQGALLWARRAGGPSLDAATGVAVDPATRELLVAGHFSETARFGDDGGVQADLASAGSLDLFLTRHSADGALLWARRAGGVGADGAASIATVGGGAVVVGAFSQTATFGAGEANQTALVSAGELDVFVARFAADGSLLWAKRAGGSGADEARAVAVDPADESVVVVGHFYSTAVFGSGEPSETPLTCSNGFEDIFVAKYRADGSLAWARRAGGDGGEGASAVAVDPLGGAVAVAGFFVDDIWFAPGEPNQTMLEDGMRYDPFVAIYEPDGRLRWVKRFAGTSYDEAWALGVDPRSGALLVGGYFQGSLTLGEREAGETSLKDINRPGGAFLAELAQRDGALEWARPIRGFNSLGAGTSLAISRVSPSLVLAGQVQGSPIFGEAEPAESRFTCSDWDGFVARYALTGAGVVGAPCVPDDSAFPCQVGAVCDALLQECRAAACGNGSDDDGDGLADADDPGCLSSADGEEAGGSGAACSNGLDDDGNQLADLLDPGCSRAADPLEVACAVERDPVVPIEGPFFDGETRSANDDFTPSCSNGPAPDRVYTLLVPGRLETLRVEEVRTSVSFFTRFHPVISLREGGCAAQEAGCRELSAELHRAFEATDVGPGELTLVVDGVNAYSKTQGAYRLRISGTIAAGEPCDRAQLETGLLRCARGICRDLGDGRGERCQ